MTELPPDNNNNASHSLGFEAFWLDVYRLMSHFLASKNIAVVDENHAGPRSLKSGYEKSEISRLLVNIASYYRVKCDDGTWAHATWLHDNYSGVGMLTKDLSNPHELKSLDFREACNKIIHAKRVHFDGAVDSNTGAQYLNPIVYLYGAKSDKDWKATLDVIQFCKAASNVVV